MLYFELAQVYQELEKEPSRLEKTRIVCSFLNKLKKEKTKDAIYLLKGKVFSDSYNKESGISNQILIKSLKKSFGVREEEISNLWKEKGDLGEVAFILAGKKKQSTLFSKKLTIQKTIENLRKLPDLEGKKAIDKKIQSLAELFSYSSPLETKYLTRTLLEDLRIGVGDGVLRDAITLCCFDKEDKEAFIFVQDAYDKTLDFLIVFEKSILGKNTLKKIKIKPGKPIKAMLFIKAKNIADGFKAVGKPCAIEQKYDGFRIIISKDEKGEIKLFTRRLEEVTLQFPEVKENVLSLVQGKSFILDAEAVGYEPKSLRYKPFQEISQRIKRKYDIKKLSKELPVEINIFDILYLDGNDLINKKFSERRKILEKIVKSEKWKLGLAEQIVTQDENKAEEFYNNALKNNQEGIMMKNQNAVYKPGARVGYGVKVKPISEEFDLVIVGAEYGTGKRVGWLTSFKVACKSKDEFLEVGKVSTGLKEKEETGASFLQLTNLLKPIIIEGKGREVLVQPKIIISVGYQEIQKSQLYSSGYALRFPRVIAIREDRGINDIAEIGDIQKAYFKQ